MGIIAVLIAGVVQHALGVTFQDGDDIILRKLDGDALPLVARAPVPPGTSAVIMQDILISSFSWGISNPGS